MLTSVARNGTLDWGREVGGVRHQWLNFVVMVFFSKSQNRLTNSVKKLLSLLFP